MHSKSDGTNLIDSCSNEHKTSAVSSQPWWFGAGHGSISMDVSGESGKGFSLTEHPSKGLATKSSRSRGNHGSDEIINSKEMQSTAVPQADGKCGEEHPYPQHATYVLPTAVGEYVAQPAHLELTGSTIVCLSYPHSDQYYGGVAPAYGPEGLVHPQCLGVNVARMALPLEMAEEPVYVNAKQYHGILRRRQTRAKLELERKLIKARKPYLHESRHLHAMRRARGCGGRFLNTKKLDNNSNMTDKGSGSGATLSSHSMTASHDAFSLGNQSTKNTVTSTGFREVPESHEMHSRQAFPNNNGHGSYFYQGFQRDHLERDYSGQQHERIVVTGVPHRALTII